MKNYRLGLYPAVLIAVLFVLGISANPACAAPVAAPAAAPVPPAILNAKRIFVSNAGADSGLFPEPFSGDPDRGYDQVFSALQTSGEYQLVSDPSQADLVLELRLYAPSGPANPNKQKGASDPLPMFRLAIYDQKSHYVLWAFTESVEVAFLQKTHDRNFDEAISRLMADFQSLAHPRPAAQ